MRNPYQILGVPESADMDEIKKAYRKLSRIYHPDANVNNPNKEQAEAKFKEIQAAYKQIVDEREHGGRSSYNSAYGQSQGYGQSGYGQGSYSQGSYRDPFEEFFGGFGGFSGYTERRQESNESTLYQAAGNYIRNGHYKEALNVLDSIPSAERNAKWYYYSAMANSGTGNNITAQEHAKKAVELEPNNYQYQSLLQQLQSGTGWYTNRGQSYGRSYTSASNCCWQCLLINCLCNGCCYFPC